MLLEAGVSALPVVDDSRCLLDVYARSDITALAKSNAYNRLQSEEVTVRQGSGQPLHKCLGTDAEHPQAPSLFLLLIYGFFVPLPPLFLVSVSSSEPLPLVVSTPRCFALAYMPLAGGAGSGACFD
jgi:hypothetical protein